MFCRQTIAAAVLYFIFSINGVTDPIDVPAITTTMVIQTLPYLLVLVGALIGFNIFLVLVAGIVASVVIGLALNMLP